MNFNIDLDTTELDKKVRELIKNFPEAGEQCIERACLVVEAKAKENCPVDLGTLRASITHKPVKQNGTIEGYVYTKEEYAPYVEFGTGIYADNGQGRQTPRRFKDKDGQWHLINGQQPKKFISNALKSERDKVAQEFRRFLDYV